LLKKWDEKDNVNIRIICYNFGPTKYKNTKKVPSESKELIKRYNEYIKEGEK